MSEKNSKLDGAKLAILSNRLGGICRKMGNTLLRTGRSGVLNRAKDFSCCIVTKDCELLTAEESLPIHVLSGPDLMARSMHEFHPNLKKGDVFLHNSPYHGDSHPADHTLLMPVIDDAGVHHFTLLAKAHQADIGNSIPTTYHGTARDVYEEGALIFPAVKVADNYQVIDDIIRMCRMRIRVPDQWYGDFLAMLGAAYIGERELLALGAEIGWGTLHGFTDQWFDYSEKRMIQAIQSMPAGSATAQSTHDAIPGTPAEGITITSKVTIDTNAAMIEVDLTDNSEALACGLNVSEACTRTSAMIGIFNSVDNSVPKNAGAFRRVKLHLKDNGVVGIPRHPISCSASTTNLADRIQNSTMRAMAEIGDGLGMGEIGCFCPPSTSVVSGTDPRNGKPYVNQLFLGHTAGAGAPFEDAWMTMLHAGNGGMCYIDSVELDEIYTPIRVTKRHLIPDSEGAGRFRGAPGIEVELGPVDCRMEAGFVADGNIHNPLGARAGGAAAHSDQFRRLPGGTLERLEQCSQIWIEDGETLVSIACGGGGYGDPKSRDADRVLRDVAEGLVSRERAAEIYGVIITEAMQIDGPATRAARAE
ncbi:MAG: hydantoinase B/oxoprolinase family protein [Rhodospirillaceae bacterium]|jgi:N-methylhydantoinase B|nr:hydantoinase B/oxoprolinase family protein [Rhodospirillaceae bacterium]MBT3887115.1 hydantoinase B/oxoprolinase family protein [Rhodospirillaceae bacterium]MBT4117389.1 hydantoinase B/oxoprolinase family protein [Rhodospirillaceae bacterium]MBT4671804.1 hydantoinase B/oxoprolinase family protein [Rhodospirillaceae bacterium]MBT5178410.1 hydantoinase B/oxoprolinase family protein [Rhodospirillaceae bacterium]